MRAIKTTCWPPPGEILQTLRWVLNRRAVVGAAACTTDAPGEILQTRRSPPQTRQGQTTTTTGTTTAHPCRCAPISPPSTRTALGSPERRGRQRRRTGRACQGQALRLFARRACAGGGSTGGRGGVGDRVQVGDTRRRVRGLVAQKSSEFRGMVFGSDVGPGGSF